MIQFKRLTDTAKLPTRKNKHDAGLDIASIVNEIIQPRDQAIIRTGIALANMPHNFVIQVWPKSGRDVREGLHTGAGIIDSGYRGEILLLVRNMSDETIYIKAGDAVAQLVVLPCVFPQPKWTEDTSDTERGADGGILRTLGE